MSCSYGRIQYNLKQQGRMCCTTRQAVLLYQRTKGISQLSYAYVFLSGQWFSMGALTLQFVSGTMDKGGVTQGLLL